MPFSGKTEAVKIAKTLNFPIIRIGDLVWDEVIYHGLKLNDENVGKIANQMREKFGKDIERPTRLNDEFGGTKELGKKTLGLRPNIPAFQSCILMI